MTLRLDGLWRVNNKSSLNYSVPTTHGDRLFTLLVGAVGPLLLPPLCGKVDDDEESARDPLINFSGENCIERGTGVRVGDTDMKIISSNRETSVK